jgi:hypothetical protein
MEDPCYYCLCNSCINNAESKTITKNELPVNWNPCFFCDECKCFVRESTTKLERTECPKYTIDNYHAKKNRKKLRVVK